MAGADRLLAGAPATNGGTCKICCCAAMDVRELAARTGLSFATAARAAGAEGHARGLGLAAGSAADLAHR